MRVAGSWFLKKSKSCPYSAGNFRRMVGEIRLPVKAGVIKITRARVTVKRVR